MKRQFAVVVVAAALAGCSATREIGAVSYRFMTSFRAAPVEQRQLPGIESVCSRGSITWIVPVGGDDVVLVDTGFDDQARAIKTVVGKRNIKAILLTHAHVDHAAGTHSLDAPVYVGRDDADALRGKPIFTSLWPVLGQALAGIPIAKGPIHEVDDGFLLSFPGDREFLAIATPGHTAGSTSWLYKGILFGGDAVQTPEHGEIHPAPVGFTRDIVAAYDSIRRLREHKIDYLADAHIGVLPNPEEALRRAVERQHDDVSILDYPFLRPLGCGGDPPDT
ncbi:MAG: MBL fold metallo-hydrolase [Deltaproteobacteria bacterium]|nr:MBL fold metallo-hydrolase [Deltaproteobacteria bacterium]